MIRTILPRLILVALPFAVWWLWSQYARRTGRELPPAPYGWLFLGGMVLAVLSMFAGALLGPEHTDDVYVPAEVVDGRVERQRYDEAPKAVDRPALPAPQ